MSENISQTAASGKFIDIEKVIREKNPNLLKFMPWFILRYMKKILHEETLNHHLEVHNHLKGLDLIDATLAHFQVSVHAYGIKNLMTEDRILVASNHPLGGLDGMALMHVAHQFRKDIVFPVNDILMNLKNMEGVFIPINKHGANPKDAVRLLDEVFSSDKTVLFFPAGLVSRKIKGKIADLEWKKTFISRARKHKRKIIPAFIDGCNSDFFYNLANFRKKIGIKANIEMFYLVNEMYKQKNKLLSVYFGQPVEPGKHSEDELLAKEIRKIAYELPMQHFVPDDSMVFDLNITK